MPGSHKSKVRIDTASGLVEINGLHISLQRLRIADGRAAGQLPFFAVASLQGKAPGNWQRKDSIVVNVPAGEALWLGFAEHSGAPRCVQVSFAGRNVVSGTPWDGELHSHPRDYLVSPPQLWLDRFPGGDYLTGPEKEYAVMQVGVCVPRHPAAGGPYDPDAWDRDSRALLTVYLASRDLYRDMTGAEPVAPASPDDVYGGWRLP